MSWLAPSEGPGQPPFSAQKEGRVVHTPPTSAAPDGCYLAAQDTETAGRSSEVMP